MDATEPAQARRLAFTAGEIDVTDDVDLMGLAVTMILLLDAHLLLWPAGHWNRLSKEARSMITEPRNTL